MKRLLAAPFAAVILAGFSLGQQSNPNPHVNDAASFGNQKAPKHEKAPTTRAVSGQVTDETGQVLEGALVTLTDNKTNEKTSFFTKKDGVTNLKTSASTMITRYRRATKTGK